MRVWYGIYAASTVFVCVFNDGDVSENPMVEKG